MSAFFDSLPEAAKIAIRKFQEATKHHKVHTAILEHNALVPVDFITAALWSIQYPEKLTVGEDKVGESIVHTCFSVVMLGHSWPDNAGTETPRHFETAIIKPLGTMIRGRCNSLAEARLAHKAAVDSEKRWQISYPEWKN